MSEKNGFNLNISRYIDSSETEDIHDLTAHLHGGIPRRDIDDLAPYWRTLPDLRSVLFEPTDRGGYVQPAVEAEQVHETVEAHPQFEAFATRARQTFEGWVAAHRGTLTAVGGDTSPKDLRIELAEDLLSRFADVPLISRYDVYQRIMDYWNSEMQDDVYLIAAEGWEVGREVREARENESEDFSVKRGRKKIKYVAELLPPDLLVNRYLAEEQARLDELTRSLEAAEAELEEFEEEHAAEGEALDGLEGASGVTKGNAQDRVGELKELIVEAFPSDSAEYRQASSIAKTKFGTRPWNAGVDDAEGYFTELDVLHRWLALNDAVSTEKRALREADDELTKAAMAKYSELDVTEIHEIAVHDKWIASLRSAVAAEIGAVATRLAGRIAQLVERYELPLPKLVALTEDRSRRVTKHLEAMGVPL